ncbi:hypothetical protein VQ056_19405 [Paenibacillus sp. JTLBN-2024]
MTAETYGAEANIEYLMGYPPLVNDEEETGRFFRVAPERVRRRGKSASAAKIMPAEDFSLLPGAGSGCVMFVRRATKAFRRFIRIIIPGSISTNRRCSPLPSRLYR